MKQGKRGRPKKIQDSEIITKNSNERRGRPKEPEYIPPPRKFKKEYEDEYTTEVWTYDLDKFSNGPINVVITYKNGLDKQKNWNKMQREAKNERRTARQMKKITIKQKEKPPRKKRKLPK